MHPEIKSKWTKALNSGDFRQGRGRLQTANGAFCCLGVLCELAAQGGVCYEEGGIYWDAGKHDGENFTLPACVAKWAGIQPGPDLTRLIEMNDSGIPFSKIADYVDHCF